jgi:hypothetical protein
MAFTEDEKLSIAKIVGITPTLLNAQLDALGTSLTASVESAVRDELVRWTTAGIDFVKVWPMESNLGVETDANTTKADIRKNIAVLLELYDYAYLNSGMGTIEISSGC